MVDSMAETDGFLTRTSDVLCISSSAVAGRKPECIVRVEPGLAQRGFTPGKGMSEVERRDVRAVSVGVGR